MHHTPLRHSAIQKISCISTTHLYETSYSRICIHMQFPWRDICHATAPMLPKSVVIKQKLYTYAASLRLQRRGGRIGACLQHSCGGSPQAQYELLCGSRLLFLLLGGCRQRSGAPRALWLCRSPAASAGLGAPVARGSMRFLGTRLWYRQFTMMPSRQRIIICPMNCTYLRCRRVHGVHTCWPDLTAESAAWLTKPYREPNAPATAHAGF